MLTQDDIITGMQFTGIAARNPINTAGDAPYVMTFQFANGAQPDDLWRPYFGWSAMSSSEKQAVRDALAHIETFINIDFVEVVGDPDPDLNVGKVALSAGTAGEGGSSYSWDADNFITTYDAFAVYDRDIDVTSDRSLLLHELGHALGLKHSFEPPAIAGAYENNKYTLMSYTENPDNGEDSDALQIFDIFALQDIWGAAENADGDSVYDAPRNGTVDAVWDTGGIDAFDLSAAGHAVMLDLRDGAFSRFGKSHEDVSIAFGTVIENALGGAGNDLIIGNRAENELVGGIGRDTLKGRGSNDMLYGKSGADVLKGGSRNDVLSGGYGDDKLFGQRGKDRLIGGDGADKFVFGPGKDRDVVVDFEDDTDMLVLRKFGFGDSDAALAFSLQDGADVIFDFGGGDVLKILNMSRTDLLDDIIV